MHLLQAALHTHLILLACRPTCREAALAEEAARRSQLDSEARVDSALAGMSGQQQQLQGRLAGLADTTEALQEQLAALQVRPVQAGQALTMQLQSLRAHLLWLCTSLSPQQFLLQNALQQASPAAVLCTDQKSVHML